MKGIAHYGPGESYAKGIKAGADAIHNSAACKGTCCTCDELKDWAKRIGQNSDKKFDDGFRESIYKILQQNIK
jgi:hypothetical protein